MSIVGLDIGTTGVKAVVFREDGTFLTAPYREYDLESPKHGHLELNPNEVLDAVREVLGKAAAETKDDPIRSLATSTLGEAMVPVDGENRPLGNAIIGFDARGQESVPLLSEKLTDREVFDIAGHGINSFHSIFKLLWRRDHDPEVFSRTRKFLSFGDFIQASLGIEPHIDYSMASRTLAFDVRKLDWSPEILDAVGLSSELLPPVAAPGTNLGALGANAKESLGRAASEMGTSTTTGDGGMTEEERQSSKTLVYQVLPSRYGMNPDDKLEPDRSYPRNFVDNPDPDVPLEEIVDGDHHGHPAILGN